MRFQQIYWGFQRFCPKIVDLRLIAHPQQECARFWRNCLIIPCITLKKPHPCPPTSPLQGDYSLHTSHWGTPTVPPPLEGAGGHAETLWKMCVKSSSPQGGGEPPPAQSDFATRLSGEVTCFDRLFLSALAGLLMRERRINIFFALYFLSFEKYFINLRSFT